LEINDYRAVRTSHESQPKVLIWEIQLLFIYTVIKNFFSITAGTGAGRAETGGCVCGLPVHVLAALHCLAANTAREKIWNKY